MARQLQGIPMEVVMASEMYHPDKAFRAKWGILGEIASTLSPEVSDFVMTLVTLFPVVVLTIAVISLYIRQLRLDLKRGPSAFSSTLVPSRTHEGASDLTVVLDLDETLISFGDQAFAQQGHKGVKKRPYLEEFLSFLSELDCEVIVWTAATKAYSKCVMEAIEKGVSCVVHHKIHRTVQWYERDYHVKDLTLLGRPLANTVMVENRPASCRLQPDNCILVPDFYGQTRGSDEALRQVKAVLKELAQSGKPVPEFIRSTSLLEHTPGVKLNDNTSTGAFHSVGKKFTPARRARSA